VRAVNQHVQLRTDLPDISRPCELKESAARGIYSSSNGTTPLATQSKDTDMKLHFALAAAVAATLAAPAFAQNSLGFAVEHFNESIDSVNERIDGPVLGTTVSSMRDNAICTAIGLRNGSIDSVNERVNGDTVTLFSGEPAHAAEIFERLRLEDDSN
jgi:hypothetical protein